MSRLKPRPQNRGSHWRELAAVATLRDIVRNIYDTRETTSETFCLSPSFRRRVFRVSSKNSKYLRVNGLREERDENALRSCAPGRLNAQREKPRPPACRGQAKTEDGAPAPYKRKTKSPLAKTANGAPKIFSRHCVQATRPTTSDIHHRGSP
jgi:hypothetical protein